MNNKKNLIIAMLFFYLMCYSQAVSQIDSLRVTIGKIIENAQGRIGVAFIHLLDNDTLTVNGNEKFPMQSVYKFPVALTVLHLVDMGKFTLDQRIHLKRADLLPNTWSPLREKYPQGDVDVTLDELLAATVSNSDNNGCDILFRLIGGPGVVEQYMLSIGIDDMAIKSTEQEMHQEWRIQYQNWSTPSSMAHLLYKFYHDSILSHTNKEYLWRLMVNTSTGLNRIKGNLPEGTIVAHKTGSSGTNENGITAATNDAGIVITPNNHSFVIVVFVSDSKANGERREAVIADISKAVWDAYCFK